MGNKNHRNKSIPKINALYVPFDSPIVPWIYDPLKSLISINQQIFTLVNEHQTIHIICQQKFSYPKNLSFDKPNEICDKVNFILASNPTIINRKAMSILNQLDKKNDHIILSECAIIFDFVLDPNTVWQLIRYYG